MPIVTLLYAAVLTVMLMVLSYQVIVLRYKLKIPVGDGGDEEMQKFLQARSNMVDYVPTALLLMLLLEMSAVQGWILHGFGVGVIVSRLVQGWGLSVSAGASLGRILGSVLIHIVLGCEVILCLWKFILFSQI